jgi:glycosyltransferase involved in cell wall biosynthesis
MVANPRVWKEANTLCENGYDVTILTTVYDFNKLKQDAGLLHSSVKYKPVVNLIPGKGSLGDRIGSRVKRRLALAAKRYFNIDSRHILTYNFSKQLSRALAENADLYIAHQETGLLIGCELIKQKKKVAFDIEDWYSRDYINEERPVNLLKESEAFAWKNGFYVTCTSKAMADALASVYGTFRKAEVIYNGFSVKENCKKINSLVSEQSLVWLSQVVGPERGLETLMEAVNKVNNHLKIHFIGAVVEGYETILQNLIVNKNHKLFFHGIIPHGRLVEVLSNYHIGLALENNYPDNRDTTITNKILQYLQAGNKVLATATKGQTEVAAFFPANVILVQPNMPEEWAIAIDRLLLMNVDGKAEGINRFESLFSWEAQEPKLLSLVQKSLS